MSSHAGLKALFDACAWTRKTHGRLPEDLTTARYLWREEEAQVAGLFFSSGIMPEDTSAVRRSLYLGKEPSGSWALCVVEESQAGFDPKKVAQGLTGLFQLDHLRDTVRRATENSGE